jgi:ATP phosphoribosyltransferase regulatory subunit
MIGTPEGLRDILFGECTARRERERGVAGVFAKHGFREVSTPMLEYYELFSRIGSPLSEEVLVKVIGRDGRICVLRPDSTAPIARLVATRLQNEPLPLKLWTVQPVYRALGGGCLEMPQAGAEVIGESNDSEILLLAREAALLVFGQTPHIEVSHAGILEHILRDVEDKKRALSLIRRKNFAELGDEFPEKLLKLVSISGGVEAIGEAESVIGENTAFLELRKLFAELPPGTVSVDFSLAPALGYYTGVFFRGYTDTAAGAVLSGGRYDRLMELLGATAPAVGFAIVME